MSKINTLLFEENIMSITLTNKTINNNIISILEVRLLGEVLNDKIFLKLLQTLELFYDMCEKKNKKFLFIVDFSRYKLKHLSSLYNYLKKSTVFLEKHKPFFKKHKYGSIIITETTIAKNICSLVLNIYTPSRPYKFFTNQETLTYDYFDFDL